MPQTIYIGTSIDGFIARLDGSIDWLMDIPNPEKSDYGFADFLSGMDGILMGRKTFETVLSFSEWPYAVPLPVFILTGSMKELPLGTKGRAEIVNGPLKDILAQLSEKGINRLYIDGGKTIQSFLDEDLIDEMILTRVPILLGSGIPLFGGCKHELLFEHFETKVFNNLLVRSRYLRKRD